MTQPICRWLHFAILIAAALFQTAPAETKPVPKKESRPKSGAPDREETNAREQRVEEMRRLAAGLKFEETGEDPHPQYTLVERPLLHFTDPDRVILDGTLWAYGREGRPVAILEMFCGREIPGLYRHAVTATSDRPVHRYSDKEEVRDAALFVLALGTNPEVLLFIEARDSARDVAAWHYGLARRGTAEFHVLLDQEEVWTLPRLTKTQPEDPICHFYRSLAGDEMKGEP